MRRALLLLTVLLGACTAARAGGNDLYASGKYAEASAAYEAQVRGGDYSANLFYNLGNTAFRLGNRGKAILNYRRALILEPGHAEALENLAFVRGAAAANPGRDRSPAWTWAAASSFWIGAVALLIGAGSRRRRRGAWAVAAAAFVAAGLFIAAIPFWSGMPVNSIAVVLEEKTRASYAPADSSSAVTNLGPGDEVRVLADRGAWLYAELPNGARGWLPAAKVERLIPRPG